MAKGEYDGVAAAFEVLLDASPNERRVQRFLKPYPYVVRNAFNGWAWNSVDVKAEFSFGRDCVADFLILSAHSGAWHTVMIELESPTARPFTKKGNPSKALAEGLAQVDQWNIWIKRNEALFREKLSTLLELKRIPAQCSNASAHQLAHTEIRDPRTVIHKEYVVVVGRRTSFFNSDTQGRRGEYHLRGHRIASYDRLLDQAKHLDPARNSEARSAG
jgi:hypothetical protein